MAEIAARARSGTVFASMHCARMSVKFFDAPISDDELANLNEAREPLDAPTIQFERQRVATAPMPFRPPATPVATPQPAAPRARRRTGQWLLAAAIVIGLGCAGHFAGARVSLAKAAAGSQPPSPQAVQTVAPAREVVAAPVVRIVAPARDTVVEPQPAAKPKAREHARREAPPAGDTPKQDSPKQDTPKQDSPKQDSPKHDTAKTDATADDDLMQKAAETLSNAQLDSP